MFQHHADRATGIDASDLPEFWQWAKANHKGQLQDALSKQMHGRDLSGYKTLAQRYMAETPPTEQALKDAGMPVRKHFSKSTGIEVFVAGSWMTPGAAARAGLV